MKAIIDVKVKDLKRAIKFYTEILDLKLRHEDKEWAAIKLGDAEIHLYLHAGITSGLDFYVKGLDLEVKRMKDKGIKFFTVKKRVNFVSSDKNNITVFPWGRNAFFNDSEGKVLALVEDF